MMGDKKEITTKLHHEKSALMDELCDINNFDGIIILCKELEAYTHASPIVRLHIHYNIGSGYSHVAARRDTHFDSATSGFALLNFRKALAEVKCFSRESWRNIPPIEVMEAFHDLRSRLLTNLANELNYQGRHLEALAYYEDPIESGNVHAVMSKARCIYRLSQGVYDDSHAFYLRREAAKYYQEALTRIDEFPPIQKQGIEAEPFYNDFLNKVEEQEQRYGKNFPELDKLEGSSFNTKKEMDYFAWCTNNRLFINELNGISISEVVNHDVLTLPSISARINLLLTPSEELSFHGHFDEMKTDYCYARYLAFMGVSMPLFEEHFFNATFEHVDTLDYEVNNLKTNHLKSCFRISYSIFDKISFLMHRFFELDGIQNDHKVDFKKVWFERNTRVLKELFQDSDNDYFKALFFISHEIRQSGHKSNDDEDLAHWFDPDTHRLFKIRNAMEHRAFKLVDKVCHSNMDNGLAEIEQHKDELSKTQKELEDIFLSERKSPTKEMTLDSRIEKLRRREKNLKFDLSEKERMSTYSVVVGVEEFETLTIKLLTLAKDALVYLSFAIHHESEKISHDSITIPTLVPKK